MSSLSDTQRSNARLGLWLFAAYPLGGWSHAAVVGPTPRWLAPRSGGWAIIEWLRETLSYFGFWPGA